ncbi:MAG: CmpA/NrtA family ABC transporter substrate-binding protein [Verrucomicrobiota bacterium]
MTLTKIKHHLRSLRTSVIRLGFVPLIDSAPLIVAKELGLFEKRGLKIDLHREYGWAAIRDKLLLGELDGAHAAAGLSLSMTLGINSISQPMLTGLILNSNGNSLVLDTAWAERLAKSDQFFLKRIKASAQKKKITLGVVSQTSSHYFLLAEWLRERGIDIQKDVHTVVLPPPQMAQNLRAGNIQGFCAGEPWGSVAVEEGVGQCVGVSSEIFPGQMEKVLLVSQLFENTCSEEHAKIREALLEACAYCENSENHSTLAEMLSPACYVHCSSELILRSLRGPFHCGKNIIRTIPQFHRFYGEDCNAPTEQKGDDLLKQFEKYQLIPGMIVNRVDLLRSIFREDLYRESHRAFMNASLPPSSFSPSASLANGMNYQWA